MDLLKYKSLEKINEIEDLILKENIYLSKIEQLNDPYEKYFNQKELPISTWESIDDIPNIVTSDARVFCVSSGDAFKNRKHMWEKYADNYAGICIVFGFSEEASIPPLPIRYVSASEFQKIFQHNQDVGTADFSFIKENIWSYEAEYRFAVSGSEESLSSSSYRDFALFGLTIKEVLCTSDTRAHNNFNLLQEFCVQKNIDMREVDVNRSDWIYN